MLALGGVSQNEAQGKEMAKKALESGKSLDMFRRLVEAQGGDVRYVDDPGLFPVASRIVDVKSPRSGYLKEVNAREVGETSALLGGGREQKDGTIDHTVGIVVQHKVGDFVTDGDLLFTIHANDDTKLAMARQKLLQAHRWSDEPVSPLPLYYGKIG
jgi:pyrimidine-nucleoside phosphorylase